MNSPARPFKVAPRPRTFHERVGTFWQWFSDVSRVLLAAFEEEVDPRLLEEVGRQVLELGPGFGWVFGPGEKPARFSFTLSGEGVDSRQLLARYWLASAPAIAGWQFFASRQPTPDSDWSIKVAGVDFKSSGCWVVPTIDEERQKFGLQAWHPSFTGLSADERMRVLFLLLDEIFGENGTGRWIGSLQGDDKNLREAMPLREFRQYVLQEAQTRGWRDYGPGEEWFMFQLPGDEDMPRANVFTWSTRTPSLMRAFLASEGKFQDPLAGTGAALVYVQIEAAYFPKGAEADKRGEIEDALDSALAPVGLGELLGGSMGNEHAYVDLLIFDGLNSIFAIGEALRELRLPAETSVHFWTGDPEEPILFLSTP